MPADMESVNGIGQAPEDDAVGAASAENANKDIAAADDAGAADGAGAAAERARALKCFSVGSRSCLASRPDGGLCTGVVFSEMGSKRLVCFDDLRWESYNMFSLQTNATDV
eukprot:3630189-Pleurochrysis_carterae.AAC.1